MEFKEWYEGEYGDADTSCDNGRLKSQYIKCWDAASEAKDKSLEDYKKTNKAFQKIEGSYRDSINKLQADNALLRDAFNEVCLDIRNSHPNYVHPLEVKLGVKK